jgi:hypothetical protein
LEEIEISEVKIWMDGGLISIEGIIPDIKESVEILFQQHMLLKVSPDNKIPGRLYLNDELVEERSELEEKVLRLLESSIRTGNSHLDEGDKSIIQDGIDYVRSDQFEVNNREFAALNT